MATRICCVWCPNWPVVTWRRLDAGLRDVPVAVLEQSAAGGPAGPVGRVRAVSREARAEGVRPGLRRREAETRCPGLVVVDSDPAAEARTFELVARAVEELTPRIELERPGRMSFPTRGPSRYYGGDEALAARVRDAIGATGIEYVRVGIGDGAFTARLAARRDAVVAPGAAPDFLAEWSIHTLEAPELTDLLSRLGLRTLAAFAALPPSAVLARFGVEGRRAHRRARAQDDDPSDLRIPPPELVETQEFDPPEARVDAAAFAAKSLADRLLTRLAELGLACTRVVIEAETEHGERFARCWRHEGALTPTALAARTRWQFEAWLAADVVTSGLTIVRLIPDEVIAATGRQLGFWGGDQAAADRADRVLTRMQGLLGHDAVVTAVPNGGRTPAERVRWVSWGEPRVEGSARAGEEPPPWPGVVPAPAPALVFDPPLDAELVDADGQPVRVTARGELSAAPAELRSALLAHGAAPVRGWAGPWAHDVRWWDRRTHRRRALWQVLAGEVACLVTIERGSVSITALYD